MIYSVKISHKNSGQNPVYSECFIEYERVSKYEIPALFNFLWALDKSDTVAQFTVKNDGNFYMPKDFGWGNFDKWVKEITYISDDKEVQEYFDNYRKNKNVVL